MASGFESLWHHSVFVSLNINIGNINQLKGMKAFILKLLYPLYFVVTRFLWKQGGYYYKV